MILVEEHQISRDHEFWNECDSLCFMSKNLYNSCLYLIKQHEKSSGSYKIGDHYIFSNTQLYHALKESPDFRTDKHPDNPKKLNTKCLKQVQMQVNTIYSSYFAALRSYKKNKASFTGLPKTPNYKEKKSGRNRFTFPKDAISFMKEGHIGLSMTNIVLKSDKPRNKIKQVSIVPSTNCYKILVSYEYEDTYIPTEHEKFAAIDLGVNNLITLSSNDIGCKPIIINGRPIKSINQYYNKQLAKKKSLLPLKTYSSQGILKLTRKRNNKIKNYIHNSTTYVVDYLLENGITCLIIGKNDGWKQKINIGTSNNQKFVGIPFNMVISQLLYKCNKFGIEVKTHEESYTSKCSFLDKEPVKKQENYLGKRTKRGLFVSSSGVIINADLNGSLNILRKVAGIDIFKHPVEAYAVMPKKLTIRCESLKQNS